MNKDFQTGDWSAPELVTGSNSAVDGHLGRTENGTVFITSAGVSGNIYNGNIYLSNNSNGFTVLPLDLDIFILFLSNINSLTMIFRVPKLPCRVHAILLLSGSAKIKNPVI